MRIDFSAPVVITDENDDEVTEPSVLSRLRGVCFSEIIFTDYFGGTPEEMAVAVHLDPGGTIELVAGDSANPLNALTSYLAAKRLSDNELAILEEYTAGSWSDGAGACLSHEDLNVYIAYDEISCRQYDGGAQATGTGTLNLYPAIRRADFPGVAEALDQGERIGSSLCGFAPLQWALLYANARIALYLIDRGADVHGRSCDDSTALETCASSRHLPDADAAEVAAVLLARGGFELAAWERTMEIAENRDKSRLIAVLKNNPIA